MADSFDMKILKRKCNQKCRDTNRKYVRMQFDVVEGSMENTGVELQPGDAYISIACINFDAPSRKIIHFVGTNSYELFIIFRLCDGSSITGSECRKLLNQN